MNSLSFVQRAVQLETSHVITETASRCDGDVMGTMTVETIQTKRRTCAEQPTDHALNQNSHVEMGAAFAGITDVIVTMTAVMDQMKLTVQMLLAGRTSSNVQKAESASLNRINVMATETALMLQMRQSVQHSIPMEEYAQPSDFSVTIMYAFPHHTGVIMTMIVEIIPMKTLYIVKM